MHYHVYQLFARNILLTPLPSHVLRLNLDLNRSLIFKMLSEKGHKLGATTKRVISTLIVQKTGQFLCFSKMFFPDFLSAITEFNIQ